jgi:tetraacyldisaccharide 4'-kinase
MHSVRNDVREHTPRSSQEAYRDLVSGRCRGIVPTLQRFGLRALSWPYGLGVRLRNLAYDRGWLKVSRAAVPVVSVGNLTLGGTGKTPCVEYVARFYRERELRVAILSRGYGSAGGHNDEAMVLEENLPDVPHLQGPDRVALAATAVEELESEVLVLDDGFQHRRLARDLDLVLVDATDPWGHGHLFPRGLLREPRSSLRRAGVVVLTRCDQADDLGRLRAEVSRLAPNVPIAETTHRPFALVNADGETQPLETLAKRPVAAFCGLGNPEAFRRTLTGCGADVCAFRTFPDHHAYTRADVEELSNWAGRLATDCVAVTTQKDLVKLRLTRLGERPLWALQVRLHVENGREALDRRLEEAVRRGPGA